MYEALKDKFDCHAFVTVSRNPNTMEVLRTILRDVSGQEYAGDIQHLIEKISNFLEDKRYFIVVDDLWDLESWEIIKCSFMENSCGSRIITTTRRNDVAEYCYSSQIRAIYINCDEDSRGLFLKRVFGTKEGCPSHLVKVCNDILKKCGGLPLAIISIAGLLVGKALTFDEWNKVQSSFGYALGRQSDVNKMIQILSLSYFDLPPHLCSCLLYLSMFPEDCIIQDYIIQKDRLVLRWIAEGFIHEEHGFSQYELGERCFNELINRSLIQPVHFSRWDLSTVRRCRVHDTILEFIVSKAMEENCVALFGVPNTISLSLQDRNEIGDAVVDVREKMIYSHARAVSVFPDCLDSLPSLDKFKHQHVLDLGYCEGLQEKHLAHLDGLLALRYLGLRSTGMHELPEEIGELQYLQTLDVRYNNELKELPSSVVHLARLVNLLCDDKVRLPDGFRSMQALRSLSCQLPGFTHELCQLRNLQNLEMLVSDVSKFTKDVVSSLSTLGAGSLNSLIIIVYTRDSVNLIMEPWSPTPLSLKILEILPKVPTWTGLLGNLRQLGLDVEQFGLGSADIDLLGRLNALSCLCLRVQSVSYSSEEAKLVKITSAHGFPSLRKFQVDLRSLGLYFEAGAMPRLQELEFGFQIGISNTRSLSNWLFNLGIQHFPCLAMVTCYLGRYREEELEQDPSWNALKVALAAQPRRARRSPVPRGAERGLSSPGSGRPRARPPSPLPRELWPAHWQPSPLIDSGRPPCRARFLNAFGAIKDPGLGSGAPSEGESRAPPKKMEGFLVSAATGALRAVTVKLATLLGDEFKHLKDVREEIEPLSKELVWMHAFLKKMSEEENLDDQDKIWMMDVREMSYDIEDSLDDFLVCFDGDESAKPNNGLLKKCKKLLAKMKARQRISGAIQGFKTQIKEVGDRNHRYRSGVMSTKGTDKMIDSRDLVIFNDVSELVGIDESKNELISLLTKCGSSSSEHQVKVVSVVGYAGLGKTTLAKQVYESLKDKFDCYAFVTVSRNPDMIEVFRTILRDVSGQEYAGDVQHLVEKISNFLEDKRYFIVVDDLWDSKSWETIKCAFIKNSCGSRIITTTRINEVAEYCLSSCHGHIYTLLPLNAMDSKRLFLKRIFGSEEGCPSHLTKVSDDILKKCGGLPLAIISIAGLLAGKAPTFDEWNRVQSSFVYALERQPDINKMIQILSLSYFDLPHHLRSCLLYFSVFPEDHEIGKDRLVMRWIAEGFIHEEHGFTQYELGEMCLNELINRSLIEPWTFELSGTLISCRVHDTILEFIVSKAIEENFVTLFCVPNTICDPHRKIRRLSLQDRNRIDGAIVGSGEEIIYSHTRAPPFFTEVQMSACFGPRRLRGLKACHLAYIGNLFALRYLGLCNTGIQELPEEIGELQYLQTLDVRFTLLRELPSTVVHLTRLVNLLCDFGTRYFGLGAPGVRLPDGFGNMQALQRLVAIRLWRQPPGFAHELCQLRNLRMLRVNIREFTKDLVSSLSTLGTGSLCSLVISTDTGSMNSMMEPWSPTPVNLKRLEIWCYIPEVPKWIGLLDNLQHLGLQVVQLGPADIDVLGCLNTLSCLFLEVRTEVADRSSPSSEEAKRVTITSAQGFPNLRKFRVGSRGCGLGLFFYAGAMLKLQEVNLEFDRDKTGSLTNGEFDFGVQNLPRLATVTCELGYSWAAAEEDPAWEALKAAVSANPNHPMLCHVRRGLK
ncbi:hypothetical protein U9M48_041982 [Paspalum notatum var. saurae]|uniref:Disease resistance protein RPM1 n=1 Tax=Paspalum notatum var. saurae TaxID=547442 RepID=A0AAQ3XH53_PASNO